ncbi:MAG: hypothetical protein OXR67_15085 [Chloroflexota bacterium]|nr:hypothetical protein [Chloroflexota bacterium]
MNIFGERYAKVCQFIGYCRELKVPTDERELERYEEIGVMLPVARLILPDEYVAEKHRREQEGDRDWDGFQEWPELARLAEATGQLPDDDDIGTEGATIHRFDQEMDLGGNPHLIRPDTGNFRPWAEYRVPVRDRCGNERERPTVEHYYSYWQVHQLNLIQEYPHLFKNAWLVELLPEKVKEKYRLPHAPKGDLLVEFKGMGRHFDALSFWITAYRHERERAFSGVPRSHGLQRLDDSQTTAYLKRLKKISTAVEERFGLTNRDLYQFLRDLIKLYQEYEEQERYKLAEALKWSVFSLEDLIESITGATREQIADELGSISRSDKKTFRHLDPIAKERDYAFELLKSVAARCRTTLDSHGGAGWSFNDDDISCLLDYCEREGLGIFRNSLSGMVAIGAEESRRNFRRVNRYSNLKNLLTAYEYLLKHLAASNTNVSGRETLAPLVANLMRSERWYKSFDWRIHKRRLHFGGNTQEFLTNLSAVLRDKRLDRSPLGYWARAFVVTCLARNMTVHSYPYEDSYYGDLYGPMLNSVIAATFYTWKFAERKKWIRAGL